jgi:phage-related holin
MMGNGTGTGVLSGSGSGGIVCFTSVIVVLLVVRTFAELATTLVTSALEIRITWVEVTQPVIRLAAVVCAQGQAFRNVKIV